MKASTRRSLAVLMQVVYRLLCLLFLILQSSVLDYILTTHHGTHWSSWIVADMVVIILFLCALVLSFIYFRIIAKGLNVQNPLLSPNSRMHQYMGELPFGYIAWGIYSLVMVSKLVIIFKTIAPYMEEDEFIGPNMLKTAIALSAVIFLLMIMCCSNAEPFTEKRAYIDQLITGTTLDIVDTTEFLEVLFTMESRLLLPFNLANSILAFGCINLILPTIALAALSHSKLGQRKYSKGVKLCHTILFLLLIDIPFLVIRIFLWRAHQSDISTFAVKNAIMIFLAAKEIWELCDESDSTDGRDERGWRRQPSNNKRPSCANTDNYEEEELQETVLTRESTIQKQAEKC